MNTNSVEVDGIIGNNLVEEDVTNSLMKYLTNKEYKLYLETLSKVKLFFEIVSQR